MGKVSISVNGRAFAVGCEDGEEESVAALGRQFDRHVTELADQVGQIGDLRLFLMAALVLADKLRESELSCETLETHKVEGEQGNTKAIALATQALNTAATRVEKLANQLDQGTGS